MPNNVPFERIGLKEVLERARRHPAWTGPLEGENRGRGLAVGFWRGGTNTSSCHITVNADGSVNLTVGAVDMTPTRTSFVQMCADLLEIPPQDVHVSVGDTDTVAHTDATGGSRITYTMSVAIHGACQDLLAQMKEKAAQRLNLPPEKVEYSQGHFYVSDIPDKSVTFREVCSMSTRGGGTVMGRGSNAGLKSAPVFSLHVADVEVDPEMGKVRILRYTTFQDAGKAINPTLVEGQMQGGAAQAIGWALTEELSYDQEGRLRNPNLLDYRMPTSMDLPLIDTDIVEVPATDGPFGARGAGEAPCVPPAAALANAIYRAVGVRLTELPMSPERVFWALKGKPKQ